MPIVSAPHVRDWMQATPGRFATRCLPMLIANQAGWFVLNSRRVSATWDGTDTLESVKVESEGGNEPALSHFGSGILTWNLPYLFRTPPGYNLLVRGPSNLPKDGAYALEGVVETDWSVATFTMNWKLTRPGYTVTFEQGEPICMLVPQRRGELESFRPQVRPVESNPHVLKGYREWSKSRSQFLTSLNVFDSEAAKEGWERHYFLGTSPDGQRASEHQTKLKLREFERSD